MGGEPFIAAQKGVEGQIFMLPSRLFYPRSHAATERGNVLSWAAIVCPLVRPDQRANGREVQYIVPST